MVDSNATQETKDLYTILKNINSADGALFGNEYAFFRGLYSDASAWTNESGAYLASDIQNICGVPPSFSGWDLNEFAMNTGSWYEQNIASIIAADKMGAICTLTFHENNPSTSGAYYDTNIDLTDILPGGTKHDAFLAHWAKAADAIGRLQRSDGTMIPVILRPLHELTGAWFWWGTNTDKAEFIQLWQWIVTYLRDTRGLHNIIYVYNTGNATTKTQFLDRWPGDAYVDVVSCDVYLSDTDTSSALTVPLNVLISVSVEKGMPAALAEVGTSENGGTNNGGMGYSDIDEWWTTKVLTPIKDAGLFTKIAWIAGWASWGTSQYHIPFPGDSKADDFAIFLRDSHIFLLDYLNPDAVWSELNHLGRTYTVFYPWVYSTEQGWEYMNDVFNPASGNEWIYDQNLGWFWTNNKCYPYIWSSTHGWLYYLCTLDDGSRWFYSYTNAQWTSFPLSGK